MLSAGPVAEPKLFRRDPRSAVVPVLQDCYVSWHIRSLRRRRFVSVLLGLPYRLPVPKQQDAAPRRASNSVGILLQAAICGRAAGDPAFSSARKTLPAGC